MNECGMGIESLKLFLADNPIYEVYDYSQLDAFGLCNRKYSYRYVHYVDDPVGAGATYSSKVLHPLVGDFYSNPRNPPQIDQYWLNFAATNLVFTGSDQLIYTKQATIDMCNVLYVERNGDAELYNYVNHEQVYWKVLPDVPNAVWLAKPDVMLERRTDGKKVSVEVKQSKYTYNRNLLAFDQQVLSQAYVTNAKLQLKLFFQYDLNRAPRVSGTGRANALFTDSSHWVTIRLTASQSIPDAELLQEWLAETQVTVERIQRAKATNIWPKKAPTACHAYNKPCAMSDLCAVGSAREFALKHAEKVNPLEYLGL